MTREQVIQSESPDENILEVLEASFTQKKDRLPKSIRTYIRKLKKAGKWEEAMGVRKEAEEKKGGREDPRMIVVQKVLNTAVRGILETNDERIQAEQEIRAVWVMFQGRMLTQEERNRDLISILDSKPQDLQEILSPLVAQIRDEVIRTTPRVL